MFDGIVIFPGNAGFMLADKTGESILMAGTGAAAAKAGATGKGAATGAFAPMVEIEHEGLRQALIAKGGTTAKPVIAGKVAGAKGIAGATAGKAAVAGKGSGIASAVKGSAIWTGKGLALGSWGPVVLGIIVVAVAYSCFNGRKNGRNTDIDQPETDLEIKDALG